METSTDYNQQALDFLNATNTSFSAKYKGHGKHFSDDKSGRDIYRITLKNDLHTFRFDFGQSFMNSNLGGTPPTAYDVLACLTKNDPESYEDFCENYGYEQFNDAYTGRNKQSYKTYLAVVNEFNNVEKLFTGEQIELLQEIQ